MTQKICIHCLIKGFVQGVSYRYYTREQANHLGLSGWVRNLRDGRVEVTACGEAKAIEQLSLWLYKGPPLAHVAEVDCRKIQTPQQVENGFKIL